MKGAIEVSVANRKTRYSFTLNRNITLVRGNSGTGKTTLYELISEYMREGENSGIALKCDKKCAALTDTDWVNQLSNLSDSVVFIDEGAKYINSREFAAYAKASDNYFVIFSRESLRELPYSADEIYEIKTSGKYHTFERMYRSGKGHIYPDGSKTDDAVFALLLTEDSRSGLEFYDNYYRESQIKCVGAGANSAIYPFLQAHRDERVFVIADGAAFGCEMDRVIKLVRQHPDRITLCLPESFEWLILSSGLIKTDSLARVLEDPGAFIESGEYFSWENFFEDYLVKNTQGTYCEYSKGRLNAFYKTDENSRRIISEIDSPKK